MVLWLTLASRWRQSSTLRQLSGNSPPAQVLRMEVYPNLRYSKRLLGIKSYPYWTYIRVARLNPSQLTIIKTGLRRAWFRKVKATNLTTTATVAILARLKSVSLRPSLRWRPPRAATSLCGRTRLARWSTVSCLSYKAPSARSRCRPSMITSVGQITASSTSNTPTTCKNSSVSR